ncbi:MAG TPA: hypothetical protein VFO66_01540 [Gemmatimonadaceae bacterium]|nr:hypothetical protein [Gemmatimonadaceae bacterium]
MLAASVLHLSVVPAAGACSMHDASVPAAGHEGMDHGDGTPQPPCHAPGAAECQIPASCTPTLSAIEVSGSMAAPAIAHVTIAAAVTERPLSRSTAPEPPPPKA